MVMVRKQKLLVVGLVFFMFMFVAAQFTAAPLAHAINTTYYVSQSGNDSNNGTSPLTPWKTMAKVSGITFAPGDQILLNRGDVWNEYLQMHGSGTSTSFITLGAYGTGPRPLIKRNGVKEDRTIRWSDASYIKVNSIAVADAGMGIWLEGSGTSKYVDDSLAYNIKGLYGTAQSEGTLWTFGIGVYGADAKITNSEVWGGGGAGLYVGPGGTDCGTGETIQKVYVHDMIDATTSFAGIAFNACSGTITNALLDKSVYYAGSGTSAVMFQLVQSATVFKNSIIRNTPDSGAHDEVGIDFEDKDQNITLDNLVFENNAGPAIEFLRGGSNLVATSNIEIKNSKFIRNNYALKQSHTSSGEIEVVDWTSPNKPTNVSIHDNQYTLASGITGFFGGDGDKTGVTLSSNTANASITYNHEPNVYAGANKTITGSSVGLSDATLTDDGGSPTVKWEQYSGPGSVTFSNSAIVNPTATFPVNGTYVLRLVGDDGTYFKSSYVTVTVTSGAGPALANAGFEAPSTSTYIYGPMTNGWTFDNQAGVQHNGSLWGATTAPEGVQTAFIQKGGQFSQSATFTAGSYLVGFQAAKRIGSTFGTQTINVYYDTTLIGTFSPTSGSFTSFATNSFTATAGSHTIKFLGTNTIDDCADFIDAVTIQSLGGGDTTAPTAVTNLAVSATTPNSAALTWTSPGNDGNTGTATSYDIRYSTSAITSGNWASATTTTGAPTPLVAGTNQSFTVTGLSASTTYYFAMKTSDAVPNVSGLSNVPNGTTTAGGSSYQASVGFSSTQGANNWSYQYWNGSTYTNMTWDSANSRWNKSGSFSIVDSYWQHPDVGADSVRKFTAPTAGTITITGNVAKLDITGGDGVNVKILKNGTQIWPASGWQFIAYNNNTGYNVNVSTSVAVNDAIYFIVNPNGNSGNDTTGWDPLISY